MIVQQLQKELSDRQELWIRKYWTTMDDNNGDLLYRLQHYKEELLDGAMYAQKMINIIKENEKEKETFISKQPQCNTTSDKQEGAHRND